MVSVSPADLAMARRIIAIPHVHKAKCVEEVDPELYEEIFQGRPTSGADALIELYGTGKLPRTYERALEEHFGTKDKDKMMHQAYWADQLPVLCPSGEIRVVTQPAGRTIRILSCLNRAFEVLVGN